MPRDQRPAKRRFDVYDAIGLGIVGFIAALWIIHFLLPTPPPLPP